MGGTARITLVPRQVLCITGQVESSSTNRAQDDFLMPSTHMESFGRNGPCGGTSTTQFTTTLHFLETRPLLVSSLFCRSTLAAIGLASRSQPTSQQKWL